MRTSTRTSRLVALLAVALAVVLGSSSWAPPARAQQAEVSAAVDAQEVELGDTVSYTLQATSSSESPSDPQPGAHPGFSIAQTSSAPSHMVSIVNGRRSDRHGLTTTWTLRADRLGTFSVGPASAVVNGTRKSAAATKITVVAPGTAKKAPKRSNSRSFDPFGGGGGSPFDPWKGIFPGIDDDDSDRRSEPASGISSDPKLALDAPRGASAFLHATVDKTRAVVGEQVTFTVFLYEDPHARQGQPADVHEATATDFLKKSLLQDETSATLLGTALVGGRPWSVKLVRKNALFPLKAGALTIAPMSLTFPQARLGKRETETITIDVAEPPIASRPAGYQIGDVGDFSLSAQVSPRTVDQHGAVGVVVELRGTGNMPGQLTTPMQSGVEWLDPQVKDALGAAQNERYGGTRTFSYVVKMNKDGAIDLGEIRLPFFDPTAHTYHVAKASLGIVQVAKGAPRASASADVKEEILPGLPNARAAFEGRRERAFVTEQPVYWAGLFGSPLACAAIVLAAGTARRVRERRKNAAPSPDRIAKERIRAAEAALEGDDAKAAVSAVARALEAGVHASTGVNVKGTSAQGAERELEGAGVSSAAAKAILEVLRACEDARFSPEGVTLEDARGLFRRATAALDAVSGGDPS